MNSEPKPNCILDVLPYYANDSDYQRDARESAALSAAGFELQLVPAEFADATWPKWVRVRDGIVFNTRRGAMLSELTADELNRARKASRSRAI